MTRSWCRTLCLLGATLLALAPLGEARAQAVSVVDDLGRPLELAAPPQRIVSLLPSLTETVCALGACARLVGVDRYSNWPAAVERLPRLGGIDDAQIERIVALKPDLVLVAPSTRAHDRLAALGVRVAVFDARTHASVKSTMLKVAQLLGVSAQGVALNERNEAEIARAARRLPAWLQGRRVYFEIDAAPYAAGASSFVGETLARLGLGNIVPTELGPFPKLNPEFILKAQPQIVMGAERNLAQMPGRPGWATLAALRQQQTCAFSMARYEMLIRPGPRLGEAAQALADCLERLPPVPGARP